MDIEEIKKYSKNKIEADDLIKQVRQQIKETIWEKQNMREGFSETFRPLISQFEDPGEDSKRENIFTQNQKMLQNQLALTKGLKANQKAITDGFSQFERLADLGELPGIGAIEYGEDDEKDSEDDKDDQAQAPLPKEDKTPLVVDKPPIAKFNVEEFNRNLNNKGSQDILESNGYPYLPSYYFDRNVSEISSLINSVNSDLENTAKDIHNTAIIEYKDGYHLARPKSENPRSKTIENIKNFNTLSIYSTNLNFLLKFKEKSGSGMFYNNPQELLHRFELLNGSLVAGNNGVLPEYIQIAHRLRDLGIITNNQLDTLLRKVI